jgi:hypothetical protein
MKSQYIWVIFKLNYQLVKFKSDITPPYSLGSLTSLRTGFNSRSVHVGFVKEKVELGKGFLIIFRLYSVSIITPVLYGHSLITNVIYS